jgi:hypothetical protein
LTCVVDGDLDANFEGNGERGKSPPTCPIKHFFKKLDTNLGLIVAFVDKLLNF